MEIACEYMMQINPKSDKHKLLELLNKSTRKTQKSKPNVLEAENVFTLEFGDN